MLNRLLIATILISMLGCGGTTLARKKVETLDRSIDSYVAALRWSRVPEARGYHRERDGARPIIGAGAMDSIRVTGHSISNKTVNESLTGASVTVALEYYHDEYGTLKELTLEQEWWYDEDSGRWFLASEFPSFR